MPASGRAGSSVGQTSRAARGAPPDHAHGKPKSAHSPRKASAQAAAGSTALRPPASVKHRAYSAPMIPRHRGDGTEDEPAGTLGDPGDDDEIAGDEFFQRYHFPQAGPAAHDEASSSSVDSSSDTEGPMSPTHIKSRQPGQSDALPSPRSPAPSVAVSALWLARRALPHH